jgi:alkaline phosphatase D
MQTFPTGVAIILSLIASCTDARFPAQASARYMRNFVRLLIRFQGEKLTNSLAIFSIYDDHEIINNFSGENNDTKVPFLNASSAFKTYYGDANPEPNESDVNYYDFRYGDNAFFVLDTRRYRSAPSSDPEVAELPNMLGQKQLHALHSWFGKVNSTTTFKFIISSVPFTSLWHGYDGQKETWAAYKIERDSLLDVMQYIPNIVLLSGDRHEFAFIEHRGKIPEISGKLFASLSFEVTQFDFIVGPLSMFAVNSMTLKSASDAMMEKIYIDTKTTPDSEKVESQARVGLTVTETIPEERTIAYLPAGNYKL